MAHKYLGAQPIPASAKASNTAERRAAHTPGPWIMREASYGWDILVLDKETDRALWIAPVHGPAFKDSPHYPPRAEVEANARLIAASPKLLAALRDLLAASLTETTLRESAARRASARDAARTAIAQATGAPRSGREADPSRSTEDTTNNARDPTPDVPASLRRE